MEQIHQLVAHVRGSLRSPPCGSSMLAGLRPAELCGLRVCDVDFTEHAIACEPNCAAGTLVRH